MKLRHVLTSAALTAALSLPFVAFAQTPSVPKTATTPKVTKAAPTAAEIADAKTKGLVWCNNNTKVYHLADSKFYGTTKNGKFMAVADAQKAGFKQAQDNPTGKKAAAPPANATPPKK
jgi:hypothetical protein